MNAIPEVIEIPGKPIAKKRPRFVRRGNFVGTYNAQETEEGRFLWEVKQRWQGEPLGGPLRLMLEFIMPIPSSLPKKKIAAMEEGADWHFKKPDLDNLVKFVKDCLNGVVWIDDSQVCDLHSEKRYGARPLTRISVTCL